MTTCDPKLCDPKLYRKLFPESLTIEEELKKRIAINGKKGLKKKAKALDIKFLGDCLRYLEITDIYSEEAKEILKTKLIQLYYKYGAVFGNKTIFDYFKENDYSKYMPDNICSFIFRKKNNYEFFISFFSIEGTKYFNEKLFLDAINKQYVNIVNFLYHNGCPLPECIFEHIANLKKINLDLINWGLEQKLPFYDTFYILCKNENLEALQLVYEHGCLPQSGKKIICNNLYIRTWIEDFIQIKDLIFQPIIYSGLDSDCDRSYGSDSEIDDSEFSLIHKLKI